LKAPSDGLFAKKLLIHHLGRFRLFLLSSLYAPAITIKAEAAMSSMVIFRTQYNQNQLPKLATSTTRE
jgi:hypothetical protein